MENLDANAGAANTGAVNSESSSEEQSPETVFSPNVDDNGLVNTEPIFVEEATTEQTEKPATDKISDSAEHNTEDKSTEGDKVKDPGVKPAEENVEKKDVPFHEHPRFKQLIEERNQLKMQIEQITQQQQTPPEQSQPKLNLNNMSEDQILDEFNENPQKFLTNFAQQVKADIQNDLAQQQQMTQQQAQQVKTQSELEQYFTAHDDALQMWQNGEIQQFLQEHPAHNPISAHMALTEKNRIQQEIENTVKAERLKWEKELKAKGRAGSTSNASTSPPAPKTGVDKRLSNPDKHGGIVNVLKTLWEESEATV